MNIQMDLTDYPATARHGGTGTTTLKLDADQTQRLIALLQTLKTQHGDTRDRLLDFHDVSWLLWGQDQVNKHPTFPPPKTDNPLRWLRSEVIDWMRHQQTRRIDLAMAWRFISRPIEVRR